MSFTNYRDFLTQNKLVTSGDANVQMIKNVGQKMQLSVTDFLKKNKQSKRIKGFKWEFNLVQNNTVNAWCMPGGKIVFYSGILPFTQDETGIAVVMGHEIAHAVARHGNERMSQQLAATLGGVSLAVAMRDKPEETRNIFLAVYGAGSALGVLAYSRQHEYEADKIGMVIMALAGYNPGEAVEFWERMSAKGSSSGTIQFLSTHPSDANRIAEMKKFMPQAMKYFKK
jgi:predicted Zn-dependent protease